MRNKNSAKLIFNTKKQEGNVTKPQQGQKHESAMPSQTLHALFKVIRIQKSSRKVKYYVPNSSSALFDP